MTLPDTAYLHLKLSGRGNAPPLCGREDHGTLTYAVATSLEHVRQLIEEGKSEPYPVCPKCITALTGSEAFELHLTRCGICPVMDTSLPNLSKLDKSFCKTGLLLFRLEVNHQLAHSARVSILTRIAKYNDPLNLDWQWADAGDRWERHALSAVQDLVAAEKIILQLISQQPTTAHNTHTALQRLVNELRWRLYSGGDDDLDTYELAAFEQAEAALGHIQAQDRALTGSDATSQAKPCALPPTAPEGETVANEDDVIRVWSLDNDALMPLSHCEDCHHPQGNMNCVVIGERLISVCCYVAERFKRVTGQSQ